MRPELGVRSLESGIIGICGYPPCYIGCYLLHSVMVAQQAFFTTEPTPTISYMTHISILRKIPVPRQ